MLMFPEWFRGWGSDGSLKEAPVLWDSQGGLEISPTEESRCGPKVMRNLSTGFFRSSGKARPWLRSEMLIIRSRKPRAGTEVFR